MLYQRDRLVLPIFKIVSNSYSTSHLTRASYESLIQELDKRYLPSHGTVIYDIAYSKWNYKCNHPEVIEVRLNELLINIRQSTI